jgi:3-hydroxy-3-methylglutaryl CoA synthase
VSARSAARRPVRGILAIGAHVPLLRLDRAAIARAIGWAVPGIRSIAVGRRSVANWDEDAITMSVEAARACLAGRDRNAVARVCLASTTAPFADRSNSGVLADALNLDERIATADHGGSRRAGTGVLIEQLRAGTVAGETLIAAADCREAQPGSVQEVNYGHGAAALLVGDGEPLAVLRGAASVHRDLVDQYRAADTEFDYALEERWVREEGWMKLVPDAVNRALGEAGLGPERIAAYAVAGPDAIAEALHRVLGLVNARRVETLQSSIGDCGAAHPLLQLCALLEAADAGQFVLLAGFGQGADALVLEVVRKSGKTDSLAAALAGGRDFDDYTAFLIRRGRLQLDFGIRAERDNRTALSAFYRRRDAVTGFVGGRCSACDTLQFPRSIVCLKCAAENSQRPESLAELTGTVKSFTEDWLAYTPCPPLVFGNVTFPGGANVLMEFTDTAAAELEVGRQVRMQFRIKDLDDRRCFRRYFWKPAAPRGAELH